MVINSFKRYENKYIVNDEQFERLISALSEFMEFDEHCKNGTYKICNVYFDTADNDVIRHSVSKPYYKEKMRFRTYGTPKNDDAPAFIEIKKKIGGIVNKRRATLTYGEAVRYLRDGVKPENLSYINRQVLAELDYYFEQNAVAPAAYVSYDRIAMFSKTDHSFRLTFDNNIQTRRYNLSLKDGSYGEQLLPDGVHLMEIKISGALPMEVARILSENGVFKTGFSKIGKEYEKLLKDKYYAEICVGSDDADGLAAAI